MEFYLGQILLLPYNFAPRGTLPCDGRLLSIAQNSALFSLLGTTGLAGGSIPVGIRNPYLGLQYVITTEGIYPSHP